MTEVLGDGEERCYVNTMRAQCLRGLVTVAALMTILVGSEAVLQAEEDSILFRQGEFQGTIFPLVGTSSAEEFYNYSIFDYQSRTSLEIPRHGIIILYRNTRTDKLALLIILNAPNAGPGGQVRLDIQGLPSTARLAVQDDPNDEYTWNPPTAQFRWRWASGRTDGVVITNLEEPFTLTIAPQLAQGIAGWKLYTLKNMEVGPERIPLPSVTEPITLGAGEGPPPQAAFHYSPEQIRVGIPVLFDARPSQVLYRDIVLYEWDFDGDGIFDLRTDQPVVRYTFTQSGTFKVTLRVTDASGFVTTISQTVSVLEEGAGLWRTISTPQVQPGGVFRVTVSLQVDVPTNGLGLEERMPVGWIIEPVHNDGAIFKFTGSRGQWIFPALLKIGETKRIVYDVRVPEAGDIAGPPLPAKFSIQGSVTSASPAYAIPVGGESEMEVVSCLSVPVALAHLNLESGQVDLRGSEAISAEQLKRAFSFWQGNAAVPGTCDAPMTSSALLQVIIYQVLGVTVDQPLTLGPSFDAGAPPPVTVSRTITTALPARQIYPMAPGGNVFQVELVIEPHTDLPGLRITEQLPLEWQVRPLLLSGAFFKAGAPNEWIFAESIPAGLTRRVTYQVIVPSDAEVGTADFKGAADIGLVSFLTPTQGDNQVEIIQCLSLPLAFAHLNVATGEIDLSLDNIISSEQSRAAFEYWFMDKEVPGTCGQKLDLATLQLIIRYMTSGALVEK